METNSSGSGEECPAVGGPSLLLLLPVLLSLLWVLVDLLYSSSLLGWAVTRLAGAFLRDSAIHLGKRGAYPPATAASSALARLCPDSDHTHLCYVCRSRPGEPFDWESALQRSPLLLQGFLHQVLEHQGTYSMYVHIHIHVYLISSS